MFQVRSISQPEEPWSRALLTAPAPPRRHRLSHRRGTGPSKIRPGFSRPVRLRSPPALSQSLPRSTRPPETQHWYPGPRPRSQRIRGRVRHRRRRKFQSAKYAAGGYPGKCIRSDQAGRRQSCGGDRGQGHHRSTRKGDYTSSGNRDAQSTPG